MTEKLKEHERSIRSPAATWQQPRMLYLTAYNILFASLWASVFFKTVANARNGKLELFAATEFQARWIQTASLVEVLHAAFGISIQDNPTFHGTAY
jgi:very-long-chain (3R)-3-hydroxyacyl-CoA dehydratase